MIRSQSYCFLTIYIFFCFFPLPNTFASPTPSLCRRDQRDVLFELQKEFHVPTTSWNKSVDCCSWEGVTCDTILGEVISLELFSLTGNASLKPTSGLFKLQHLRELHLSGYNLQGEIPSSIGDLSHLTSLHFSFNHLQGEIPSSIGNLSHLTSLYFSLNILQGEIPSSIGNLSHLTSLDISSNNLQGEIPSSIGNLSHLTFLDFSGNQLVDEVPASLGNLNQLRYMDLSGNNLRGNIPTSFANLTKLSYFYLCGNQFTGGDIVLANLTSLSEIDLSSNHFKSSILPYLSGLHKLEQLFAYNNSFAGPFPSFLLMIPSLVMIDLSQNQFEGHIDLGNTSSSSKLEVLAVSDNNFDGLIPESISKLVNLTSLDLSYNRLEGQVPQFLWRSSKLDFVMLSHNSLSSLGKSVEIADAASLQVLDLGSNSLQEPFPQWICNSIYLHVLDMSNNHFTGSIPQCLKNLTSLEMLNLRNNNLSGFLPDLCISGSQFSHLESLDVSRNNLVGKLPKSLIKCKYMGFLNVRGNKIKDTFPFWLGSLQYLMVLVLRSNAFYGPVYNFSAYLGFPSLQIIDISNNKFVGSLPQDYFANWPAMSLVWDGGDGLPYIGVFTVDYRREDYRSMQDSMDLVYKGVDTYFDRIFEAFNAIDFSGNQFSGQIPKSIGLLSELSLLNLSGNTFTGSIPPSLANITKLETLDLSRNNLSGEIPQGLGKLTFLSNINFSHNHLEGLVPQSTQFGSQNCSSFVGNLGLYGLEKICGEIHVPVPTSQQPEESLSEAEEPMLNWIPAAIAFGPGVFCGLVIGHIFTSYKHESGFVKFVLRFLVCQVFAILKFLFCGF